MTGTFPVSAFRNADAHEGLLEGCSCRRQVGAFGEARLECPFRLAARLLRTLQIDLRCEVGRLGHHHDLVRADLDEATDDGERFLGAALANPQFPVAWWGRMPSSPSTPGTLTESTSSW
jgi:hypothetical protein